AGCQRAQARGVANTTAIVEGRPAQRGDLSLRQQGERVGVRGAYGKLRTCGPPLTPAPPSAERERAAANGEAEFFTCSFARESNYCPYASYAAPRCKAVGRTVSSPQPSGDRCVDRSYSNSARRHTGDP